MTEFEKDKYVSYIVLHDELRTLEEKGLDLSMSGKAMKADDIAYACAFNEGNCYMRDYVTDESGNLIQINFDNIY